MTEKINYREMISLNKNYIIFIFVLFLGFTILSVLVFKSMDFISDDYFLLKASIQNHFPYYTGWIGTNDQFLRPVVILSFYINYYFSGFNSYAYYLTNYIIHIINALIIAINFLYVLKRYYPFEKAIKYSIITLSVFLVLPQNIYNVFWIAGRTDLIMSTFLFLSLYSGLKYMYENSILHFVLFPVLLFISLMSKETALISIFYFIAGFMYVKRFSDDISKRYKIISIILFLILFVYFIYRYLVFSLLFGDALYEINIIHFVKYFIYGIFTLLMPIDFIDFYTLIKGDGILFVLLSVLIITFIAAFIRIIFTSSNIKIIIFLTIIIISSLILYMKSFPSMRLMYSHFPLLLFPLIELTKDNTKIRLIHQRILLVSFIILMLLGISSSYYKFITAGKYMNDLKCLLYDNVNKNEYKIVNLAAIVSLGQCWLAPESNILFEIVNNKELSKENIAVVTAPMGFQITGFWNKFENLIYETNGENEIIIKIGNDMDVIKATKEVSYNIKFVNDYYILENGFEIFCLERNELRKDYLKSIKIRFPDKVLTENTDVIYLKDNNLYKINIIEFLKEYKSTYH